MKKLIVLGCFHVCLLIAHHASLAILISSGAFAVISYFVDKPLEPALTIALYAGITWLIVLVVAIINAIFLAWFKMSLED